MYRARETARIINKLLGCIARAEAPGKPALGLVFSEGRAEGPGKAAESRFRYPFAAVE